VSGCRRRRCRCTKVDGRRQQKAAPEASLARKKCTQGSMHCVWMAIYVGPHLLLANTQGGFPPSPPHGADERISHPRRLPVPQLLFYVLFFYLLLRRRYVLSPFCRSTFRYSTFRDSPLYFLPLCISPFCKSTFCGIIVTFIQYSKIYYMCLVLQERLPLFSTVSIIICDSTVQ
jgi:hypothetical protein